MIIFEEIIKKAKRLMLTESEKSQIRGAILNIIKETPVRLGSETRLILRPLFLRLALFSLIILTAGAGIAGAENSLPGDLLYPIKTEINEKIRERLALSETAKTSYETGRIERRLEESEQLMLKGRVDKAAEQLIKENLMQRIENIKNKAENIKTEEDLEKAEKVTSRIERAISTHESMIEKILENKKIRSDNLKEDTVKTAVLVIKAEMGASKRETKKLRDEVEKFDKIIKEKKIQRNNNDD